MRILGSFGRGNRVFHLILDPREFALPLTLGWQPGAFVVGVLCFKFIYINLGPLINEFKQNSFDISDILGGVVEEDNVEIH